MKPILCYPQEIQWIAVRNPVDCIIQLLNNWGLSHAALGRNVAFCKTPLAAANSPNFSASEQSNLAISHTVSSVGIGKRNLERWV